ncbi:MAG: sigma-70 family RNA polymerase sigma factor, partial [Deltaproteobacteria bacterium]|nr:sigma-70 family RNA polymerase sigma factor [Nannocystaceae bacterium]
MQRARLRDGSAARAALEELCAGYWPPLYAWARRRGHSSETAEELIQDFFAALLGGDSLLGFDRERGRFRSWLLGALRHHESRGRERERAGKRGGGAALVAFDAELAERVHAGLG